MFIVTEYAALKGTDLNGQMNFTSFESTLRGWKYITSVRESTSGMCHDRPILVYL